MSLSHRLTLLILLCVLPMAVAAVVTLKGLYEHRMHELASIAEQQVNVVDAGLADLTGGAEALLFSLAQTPLGGGCAAQLDALRRNLPAYHYIGIVERPAGGGGPVDLCGSRPGATIAPGTAPAWLSDLPAGGGIHVGHVEAEAPGGGVLPLTLRVAAAGGRERIAVALLDLGWLAQHLADLRGGSEAPSDDVVTVLDRNGAIVARVPNGGHQAGAPAEPALREAMRASGRGVIEVAAPNGRTHLLAASPPGALPDGLFVAAQLDPDPLMANIQDAMVRSTVLGVLGLVAALLIAAVAARRGIQQPTARLLAAARRWAAGDFSARVEVAGDRSEFGFLAKAFNRMAADIEARIGQYAQQARQLETLVAERTRELSDRNNRLQVEIAERRRAETGLHQAQKLQAVGQLAGGIAHDFNNLLATILGSLELVERRVDPADQKAQALLTRAIDAVQRGSTLTSRLLAFSRRQRLAARPTDINRLTTDLVALATSTLGRGVRVQTHLATDLWPAMVDPGQLEAALLNLALNARDAMPRGGVIALTTSNRTVADDTADAEAGDYVAISVADTGEGMSPETLARAFEPFFTTKELGKGSGLGLSQVYGLAQQSGGAVSIQSEPGAGTTVTLLLPRAVETVQASPPPPKPAPARATATLVLLVDDDADVRHVSAQMLHGLGYEVVEASDGEHALAVVRDLAAPPAILMLDYAMPGMNGLQLAARLRECGVASPLVLATGYAELAEDGSGVRPNAILHKPFSRSELDRTLAVVRAPERETA